MICRRGNRRGRSWGRLGREVTLMMVVLLRGWRGRLLLLLGMVMMLLLGLLLVVGQRGRELGWIGAGGARVHRVVVTLPLVHFDPENLQLLPRVSLSRVRLLEARQGC